MIDTSRFVFACCLSAVFVSFCSAADVGELDDFESGVEGWIHPINNPLKPRIEEGAGPAGDAALSIQSSGMGREGSRLVAVNQSQWLGDFGAIDLVQAHVRNTSDIPLSLRLGFDGDGGRFVTESVPVETESGWQTVTFLVSAEDLLESKGDDAAETLANVEQLRLLHNASLSYLGARVEASFLVDNIIALPATLPGDVDLDLDVDTADQTTTIQNWTGAQASFVGKTILQGDTDGDGDVDVADRNALVTNWTGAQALEARTAPVPEPATGPLGILAAGFCGLLYRRFQRVCGSA